jgi:hypothetical protein
MMRAVGIKRVYYSVENEMICENVSDMISIQVSSITKHIEKKINKNIITSPTIYYSNLLKNCFPDIIKKKNLLYFINYNLLNVLPDYYITIKKNNVMIYDNNDDLIVKATII